jgi:hypothetical protein
MKSTYYEWKWSNGEPYYKSCKKEITNKQDIDKEDSISKEKVLNDNDNENENIGENAIQHSLDGFDSFPTFSRNNNPNSYAREELDTKISDRELLFQRGINPYLPNNSYVNDVVTRDKFLKPQNTSSEKTE